MTNMNKLILVAGLCLSITSLACSSKLVCYVTSWSVYRSEPAKFGAENIDPSLCTHLIFAYADIKSNKLVVPDGKEGAYLDKLSVLRQNNPHLSILVAIGGWNLTKTARFRSVASTRENRKTFIDSTIALLRARHFDGIDLDWEYPQSYDKDKFSSLCQEFYQAFEAEAARSGLSRLLVTAAVHALPTDRYDVPLIAKYLDFINVMTYDFHGSWEPALVTGHHSPLHNRSEDTESSAKLNAERAMKSWKYSGAPPEKLNMGFATYGRTFTLSTPSKHDIGAPVIGPGLKGNFTKTAGFMTYYEVCDQFKTGSSIWSEEQKVPYGVNGHQWVGYDNEMSIGYKVDFVKENNFGGGFVWSLDMDDFNGTFCGTGKFPLVQHLHNLLRVPKTTTNTTASTTPATASTTTITTITSCDEEIHHNFCKGKENIQYSVPGKPHCFYNCWNGFTRIQKCVSGLVFSEVSRRCEYKE